MNSDPSTSPQDGPDRREFVKACCAVALGGAAALTPVAAGLNFASDPMRRRAAASTDLLRIASLGALPADGQPRKFVVSTDRTDAWNRYPGTPVGAVYLRRTGPNTVDALTVICPHAGCAVDFRADRGQYFCPCHNSSFAADGSIADKRSPSARALDSLDVEVREGGEIWVRFMNFRAGIADKVPVV